MKPLVLFYDGPCILCNYWVRRLCIWDKNDQLRFTSLDSDYALGFFKKHPSPLLEKDAILSWDSENGYFSESEVLILYFKTLRWVLDTTLALSCLPFILDQRTVSLYRSKPLPLVWKTRPLPPTRSTLSVINLSKVVYWTL
jgi:predicted DCC family thiol-disulfide oxidoreductase YuxK